jgi:hypothetical protein
MSNISSNHSAVLADLLERVKALEEAVARLQGKKNPVPNSGGGVPPPKL